MSHRITALAAGLALAAMPLAAAGCGNKEPGIPRGDAAELIALLKTAQKESDDPQKCDQLLATVRDVAAKVRALPSKTDSDVRDSLTNGVRNLAEASRTQCQDAQTDTTTTTTPTVPTETVPPPTTETTPPPTTETTPPPTSTETTPPATTPPVPTTPGTGGTGPGNSGGNNGNGVGPGGGEKRGFGKHGKGEK